MSCSWDLDLKSPVTCLQPEPFLVLWFLCLLLSFKIQFHYADQTFLLLSAGTKTKCHHSQLSVLF